MKYNFTCLHLKTLRYKLYTHIMASEDIKLEQVYDHEMLGFSLQKTKLGRTRYKLSPFIQFNDQ